MSGAGHAAAYTTPGTLPRPAGDAGQRRPRVAGYLRFILGSPAPDREDVLRAAAAARGYQLVTVVRSTGVSTLTSGCPGIVEIFGLIDRREIDGVLTLADYTLAWDVEVVRRIAARIRDRAGFLDYVWPARPTTPPTDPDRTYR